MATVSQKISTSEILELLRTNSDHTKFFYMYVSTFGRVEGSEMDSLSQPIPPLPVQENPVAQNSPVLPSTPTKKAQEKAMAAVHKKILPELLYPCGWKKVYDKDMKIAYRALYFNTIEKQPNEDDITHIQRVVKYREMISDKVEKLKEELHVNLEINFLLSRPLLYDPVTLQEQPLREGFTTK